MQIIYSETKPLLKVSADTPAIDTAPIGIHEGMRVYPNTVEVYRQLRAVKAPVTSPINRRYKWAGKYTPFTHQKNTAAFLTLHRRAYVLNDLGTGKTLSCIWAMDYLMQQGLVNRALILTPLSTVLSVWQDAFFTHFPHIKTLITHGQLKKALIKDPKQFRDRQVFIANHEATWDASLRARLLKELKIDLLIVDEGSLFHAYGTNKFKGLRALTQQIPNVWWMTATPTPNSPVDAWGQAFLMGTHKGIRLVEFRDLTMRQVNPGRWVARPGVEQHVASILSPSIRYKAEDCIDLPTLTYQTRQVPMTKDQINAYKQLQKEAVLMTKAGMVTAVNQAVMITKLLQIACGVVYTEDRQEEVIEPTAKIAEIREVLESTDSPVILFVPFKSVINYLARTLHEYKPVLVTGEVEMVERADIVRDFQEGKTRLLIAHPRTTSHGITLTRSSVIVWYCPVHSNDIYKQANGRIYRQGQTQHCSVVHLSSSDVETDIYRRLREKENVQNLVLTLLTRGVG